MPVNIAGRLFPVVWAGKLDGGYWHRFTSNDLGLPTCKATVDHRSAVGDVLVTYGERPPTGASIGLPVKLCPFCSGVDEDRIPHFARPRPKGGKS
jgi:hypothetical protein